MHFPLKDKNADNQDVGLDGYDDTEEASADLKFSAFDQIYLDPANDNYDTYFLKHNWGYF